MGAFRQIRIQKKCKVNKEILIQKKSKSLSMANTVKDSIESRIIGFIMEDGVDVNKVNQLKSEVENKKVVVKIIAGSLTTLNANDGTEFEPDHSLTSTASVCFDALYICVGKESSKNLLNNENKPKTLQFVNEAYKHCKGSYLGDGTENVYEQSNVAKKKHDDSAIITSESENAEADFIKAISNQRAWEFEKQRNNLA